MKLNKLTIGVLLSLGLINQCHADAQHKAHKEHDHDNGRTTTIKIVAFNDFHGQLESPGSFRQTPASPFPPIFRSEESTGWRVT